MAYWKRKVMTAQERLEVEESIKRFRENTGSELLLAVARASSSYGNARLRLGVAFMFTWSFILLSIPHRLEMASANPTLIVGGQLIAFSIGLLGGNSSPIKRAFLTPEERRREVRARVRELFHTLGLTQLNPRTGTLLYLSVFEKRLELAIDDSMKSRIHREDLNILKEMINKELEGVTFHKGLLKVIQLLEEKYQHFHPEKIGGAKPNQISHHVVWPEFS